MKISHKFRKIFSNPKKLSLAIVGLAMLAAVPLAVKAEFYPDRPTYNYNKPCNPNDNDKYDRCGSLEGPVFNSFINTPSYGDERAFLDARRSDQTASGSYKNVLPDVTKGSQKVVMRMYVHNNANQNTNASGKGIAKNTKVRVALPQNEDDALRAVGYISADNAKPRVVEDTVDMTSTEKFRVEYIPGSATIYSNGPVNGKKLSDNIVSSGAPIGHNALNGKMPGCFQYEAVVQITVKVIPKENPNLQLVKEVKKVGEESWKKEVATKPGDEVKWLLSTKNISNSDLTKVSVRDVLPPHVRLVPGSVRMIDANQDKQQQDGPLFSGGFVLGNYPSGGTRYVMFNTISLDDFDKCEIRVRNVAIAKSDQTPEVRDDADVVIKKEDCQPPTPEEPKFSCDLLKVDIDKNRKATFTVNATAENGAEIKQYRYDFGDGTDELVTDQSTVTHTYAEPGQYAIRAKVDIEIDGEITTAESEDCTTVIDFPKQPEVPPTVVTAVKPGQLPETGPGDVLAVFLAVTAASSVAYFVVVRRLSSIV